jgi:uncharacterized protein YbjT (DUF2867 family)
VTTTVLVIGASGQLGAPVVRRLLEDGFRVRLLVRASGSLGDTIPLMGALQDLGERGDPSEAVRLLGPATTNLADWCSRRAVAT